MNSKNRNYPIVDPPKAVRLCIVVPCYNEAKKFRFDEYSHFLRTSDDTVLCFVNDGSTDKTLESLLNLKESFPQKIEILSYEKNKGKAEAVRKGMLHSSTKFNHGHIAYLDADLAVSLEECRDLSKHLNGKITFCFGSRILKLGSTIERKRFRFLVGRVIATLISETLALKVYDTQCGCKLFTKKLAAKLFASPFLSKWLFDVELFFRMMRRYGKPTALTKMVEIPLVKWQDRGDSKVRMTYFFRLFVDLYQIKRRYSGKLPERAVVEEMVL